ncbi:MAG TPA: hypothetical protein VLZ10_20515 [Thermodesulfobacteriota bacterium]|nr:hypothetical protein [Thermodesulfobacteriota bacterium]
MAFIDWPVDLERSDRPNAGWEFVIPVRTACLHLRTFDDILPEKRITMRVSFPRGTEYESFRVETEIAWKKGHFWNGWEQYHYALTWVEILNGHYLNLKRRLYRFFLMEEVPVQIRNQGGSL